MSRFPVKILSAFLLLVLSLVVSDGAMPAMAQDTGSISGIVYFDADLDGQRDAGEPPAPRITVNLYSAKGGGDPATTLSGDDGSYHFDSAGDQGLHQISAISNGCASDGSYDNRPGADGSTDVLDLGLPVPGEGRVSGVLWSDLNENGVRDAGEPSLADWYVYLFTSLYPKGAPVYCGYPTVHTGSEGEFTFDGLSALPFTFEVEGPYAEIYNPETQWEVTAPLVPDTDSPFADGMRFDSSADLTRSSSFEMEVAVHLLLGTASLEGLTYQDSDADNVRDAGEPVAECRGSSAPGLYRWVPGIGVLKVTQRGTCQDKRFRIDRLPPGDYNVGIYLCCCPPRALQAWIALGEGETMRGIEVQGCPAPFPPTSQPNASPEPSSAQPSEATPSNIAAPPAGTGAPSPEMTYSRLLAVLAASGITALAVGAVLLCRPWARKEGHHV